MSASHIHQPNGETSIDDANSGDQAEPGPFPIDSLSETQRRITEAVACVYQLPLELAAMPAIAVTGAAMGKAWKLVGAVNGRENFGNLYIVVGAPKSSGKGAAAQLSEPIFRASEKLGLCWKTAERPKLESRNQFLQARAKHLTLRLTRCKPQLSEGLWQELEPELVKINAELEQIKALLAATPSYHVGNATSEALAIKLARNNDTLFTIGYESGDTLRILLGKKYSKHENADVDLWLSGYSVEPHQSDRVQRGNTSICPCHSALLFCQPSLVRELFGNEEAFERGLTARMLALVCEPPLKEDDGKTNQVPAVDRDGWDNLVTNLLERRKHKVGVGPAVVNCDEAAREILCEFHNESIRLRTQLPKDVEGELGRCRETACRIGLGLCIADDPSASTLTKKQAERAVRLARWAHLSTLRVMNSGRLTRSRTRLDTVLNLLNQHGGEVSLRDMQRSHGITADKVEILVAKYPDRLGLQQRQNPKGGPRCKVLVSH